MRTSQAIPWVFGRTSLHDFCLQLLWLFHVGGLDRQVGGRGTAMEEVLSVSVQDSAGASGGGCYVYMPSVVSTGSNASGGSGSLDASVQSSQGVSAEDDVDDRPLPELGGRASREQRWLG